MAPFKTIRSFFGKPVHKVRKELKKIEFNSQYRRFQDLGPDQEFPKFTADWLIHREILYGGIQKDIRVGETSPFDPRTEAEIESDRMRGGDRMLFHGYAEDYSGYLKSFNFDERLVVAEFGILRGNGLAIWCDLFPNARVLGFDIDTGHFEGNRQHLLDRGAFSSNSPEVYKFDQFVESTDYLGEILSGNTIDVCIDDGCHFDEAILCTMRSVMPYLRDRFVYFVEDNSEVHTTIRSSYPELNVYSRGPMTVIDRNLNPQFDFAVS
ncbi:MAG: hypothetical protein F4Y62_09995 [Rhodospirillaceae bacterium]|nr:hypothetical protein [Rhodospirillaceae bacterium]MYF87263.1 hypothetical protein [Rhodospirillaceae bacterium]